MCRRKLILLLSICAVLLWSTGSARAVLVTENFKVPLTGTTSVLEPWLAGEIIVDEVVPFSFPIFSGGNVLGDVQVRIVRSDLDSTLDFYWCVSNDAQSSGPIGSLRIGDFGMSPFEADYRIDSVGDTAPSHALGFATGLNFIFETTPLEADYSSNFFFVDTLAMNYARTAIYDLTGTGTEGISGLFSTYAPAPVPEPATMLLLCSGLIGLAGFRRRFRKR